MRIRLLLVGVVRTSKKEASSEGLNTDQPRPPAKKKEKKKKKKETDVRYLTSLETFLISFLNLSWFVPVMLLWYKKSLVSSWGSWLHMLFFLSLWKSNCCVITWTVLISNNQKHNVFFCWEYTAQNVRGLQRYISPLKILTTSLFNCMS